MVHSHDQGQYYQGSSNVLRLNGIKFAWRVICFGFPSFFRCGYATENVFNRAHLRCTMVQLSEKFNIIPSMAKKHLQFIFFYFFKRLTCVKS